MPVLDKYQTLIFFLLNIHVETNIPILFQSDILSTVSLILKLLRYECLETPFLFVSCFIDCRDIVQFVSYFLNYFHEGEFCISAEDDAWAEILKLNQVIVIRLWAVAGICRDLGTYVEWHIASQSNLGQVQL